jgi:hypothetical protein
MPDRPMTSRATGIRSQPGPGIPQGWPHSPRRRPAWPATPSARQARHRPHSPDTRRARCRTTAQVSSKALWATEQTAAAPASPTRPHIPDRCPERWRA